MRGNRVRLSECNPDDVVRNIANENYYRFVRPEDDRARIRPLELFPNGLLIEKPTDTIVAADIAVERVGVWSIGMAVSSSKGKSRQIYERERERCVVQLDVLESESLVIEPKRRGSHANRVKAVRSRIASLDAGLQDLGTEPIQVDLRLLSVPPFKLKQVVVMPSGRPARFLGLLPHEQQLLATVACSVGGSMAVIQVDPQALRPADCRHMATV